MTCGSHRSKTKALSKARQLVKDGETELSELSKRAAALDEECDRIHISTNELEVRHMCYATIEVLFPDMSNK